ncbi:SpoIIE family protein phosphatase [Micromonospora mangrovi]|uniref:SpoIIE family protein phosphatase n=2 Tax=Micromonospora TaxID=1873 RepID=A0AAU8HLA1_9ACTN
MSGTDPGWSSGDPAALLDAFEQFPGFVWVFEGPELRVVAANPAVRAAVGNRSDLIGQPFKRAVPELHGQHIFELLDEALQGVRSSGQEQRILTDRAGDGALEEAFYTFELSPWLHPDGSVRGVIVQAVDATSVVAARRAAESAAAVSERRYQHASDLVLELQRSLLPDVLPVLPEVQLAAHYLVADDDLVAGGDWFDAVALPDGRVALTVGDVVGHGATAAAAMGQLRAVVLQALHAGGSLPDTLRALDHFAGLRTLTRAATTCLAVLDPATGALEVASHAHPPPLVIDADGVTRFLPVSAAGPLGTRSPAPEVHTTRLRPGDTLLLYTDGLIERPHQSLRDGSDALAAAAEAATTGPVLDEDSRLPDRICAVVTERLARTGGGYRDDTTLLAAHLVTEPVRPLHLTLPADPATLRPLRRQVTDWLTAAGAGTQDTWSLIHALGEAAANAVEHADPGNESATFQVEAVLDAHGVAWLTCTDQGRWRPPTHDPANRGRGLAMIRGLVDHTELDRGDRGTRVRMGLRLSHPSTVTTTTSPPGRPGPRDRQPEELTTDVVDIPGGRALTVRGPVDMASTARLQGAILQAGRGGGLPLTVDLTGVSHLSSAGVRLLHDLTGALATLRVTAGPTSPAYAVLTLTGLRPLDGDAPPTPGAPVDAGRPA